MKVIYTITPNPALDLGGDVETLIPSEKAYVHHETQFPGGNAINAARIIHKLGLPVIAGGFLGGGVGRELEELLQREGVACAFIQIRGQTRIGVTVTDQRTRLQTRLSFPGPRLRSIDLKRMARWISGMRSPALIVIGGSLPPGFSPAALIEMMQKARIRGIPCVVDTPGKVLKKLISHQPLLIKPNLTEFQELVGKKVTSVGQVLKAARKQSAKVPLICVSSVEGGALMITPRNAWFGRIPRVKVRTTVGAGDSMVGAMTAQLWRQRKNFLPLELGFSERCDAGGLLRWGLAAATAH